ncbi:MAG: phosphatidylglycerol lysyltransferase domain-containing protein [Candidatus Aenigmarchaeota archaeon]|nr:phosphatidylglycerol lysyltransferase domain-containing protein [Candidatus Aenigmarchaeota archaeon]
MEVLENVKNDTVKKIIETQGHQAEHNFYHYLNVGAMYDACVFPVFEEKYGIMGFKDKDNYWCYTDPLAPEEKSLKFFMEFVKWAFSQDAKKVRAEINEKLWKDVVSSLQDFRAIKPSFIYFWPVYDLKKWSLSGIPMKKLRNRKNAFEKNHKIEILGKENIAKGEIIKIIEKWKKARKGPDVAHVENYISAVENNFSGYDSVRFIAIDGTVHGVNGGWKIPNSNNFYSQLGLHDYSVEDIGEYLYIEDLTFLKNAGFDFADFGGSGKDLLAFKRKFLPTFVYKTIEFSILPKRSFPGR